MSQDSVVDASGERVSMISTDVLMGVDEVYKYLVKVVVAVVIVMHQ